MGILQNRFSEKLFFSEQLSIEGAGDDVWSKKFYLKLWLNPWKRDGLEKHLVFSDHGTLGWNSNDTLFCFVTDFFSLTSTVKLLPYENQDLVVWTENYLTDFRKIDTLDDKSFFPRA